MNRNTKVLGVALALVMILLGITSQGAAHLFQPGSGLPGFIDNATPVSEPVTMLLLGSGLIGLAGYWRKKFFKK